MHLKRWLTSIIALPLLLLILLKGSPWIFAVLILMASVVAHGEFLAFAGLAQDWQKRLLSLGLGAVVVLSFGAANSQWPAFLVIIGVFLSCLFYLFHFEKFPDLLMELPLACFGLIYIPFLLGHFIWLRVAPDGQYWILWLMGVIFAGDTGAFYSGRWLGQRKLYPAVSPGKTVAGAVGGLTASGVIGIGGGIWLFPQVTRMTVICLTLSLALIGQFGDLFESMLKRRAQVKDAGQLLPGHGGLLDRLDSLLFSGAWVYYYVQFFC